MVPIEDASGFKGAAARLAAPASEAELVDLLGASSDPVTVVGALSGVTGGAVPESGLALNLSRFTRRDLSGPAARCGAGLLLQDLQAALKSTRYFYPPDPTYNAASLGGTWANNASGSRSFRYGSTRAWVTALRACFADGSIREFRRGEPIDFPVPALPRPRSTKHQAGYPLTPGMDWIDLLIGSEGTLAILLEAELRLLPNPPSLLSGVLFFPTEADTLAAVDAWRPLPHLRMLEFLDSASLDLLRELFPEVPPAAGALLIEQEGDDTDYLDDAPLLESSWFGTSEADRERFRKFRHALPERVNDTVRRHGFLKMGTDYAVPPDRAAEMMAYYRDRLASAGLRHVIFGHIGDAHLHVNLLPANPAEAALAQELILDFARQAVALEGTVGAEHGLGKRKRHLLELLYRPAEIEAMKAVKRRLDPHWRLGPGTLFAAP